MALTAFIASLAIVWLMFCFIFYIKDIVKAFKTHRFPKNLSNTVKKVFTSLWGHDFWGSLVIIAISTIILLGVTGMLVGLFASLIFSAIMWLLHFAKKHENPVGDN